MGKVIRGVKGLNRTLNALPKVAQARIRDASVRIAADVATDAASRARSGTGGVAKVAKYVAPTIRATRDRVPVVRMGGTRKLPARDGRPRIGVNQTVGNVMWGSEWGSTAFSQFSSWSREGYVLFPSIDMDKVEEQYADALTEACRTA